MMSLDEVICCGCFNTTEPEPSPNERNYLPEIIGGVSGGAILLVAVIAVTVVLVVRKVVPEVFLLLRRTRRAPNKDSMIELNSTEYGPMTGVEYSKTSTRNSDKKITWKLNYEDLQIASEIGVGTYGRVYKGTWRGIPVAGRVELLNVIF